MARYRALTREHAEVSEVAALFGAYLQREADLASAREMEGEAEMADMAREEIASIQARSEEHTSELQSRQYLVCRLLLEKKQEIDRKAQGEDFGTMGQLAEQFSGRSTG